MTTSTEAPAGLYLQAFDRRFRTTIASCVSLASTTTSDSASTLVEHVPRRLVRRRRRHLGDEPFQRHRLDIPRPAGIEVSQRQEVVDDPRQP